MTPQTTLRSALFGIIICLAAYTASPKAEESDLKSMKTVAAEALAPAPPPAPIYMPPVTAPIYKPSRKTEQILKDQSQELKQQEEKRLKKEEHLVNPCNGSSPPSWCLN